jgi:hypothetical protein
MRPILALILLALAACASPSTRPTGDPLRYWKPPTSCFTNAVGQTLCQ